MQLAELALLRLGARPFHIVVPTPRNPHPVPVRSTGASAAIGGLAPVVSALGQAGFIVDCTLEGLMHAPETPAILKSGARILYISNEHPEALERMRPDDRAGDARARGGKNAARIEPHDGDVGRRHRSRRRHGGRLDGRNLGLDREARHAGTLARRPRRELSQKRGRQRNAWCSTAATST